MPQSRTVKKPSTSRIRTVDIPSTQKQSRKPKPKPSQYPFIPLALVNRLEAIAEFYDISLVSRGKIPPNKTDKGFLVVFRNQAHGDPSKLNSLPILAKNPDGNTWDRQRDNYILRRLAMVRRANTNKPGGLWVQDGPLTGLPSVLHVNMMMWAYSPDPKMRTLAGVNKVLARLAAIKKEGIHAPKRPGISAYGNRQDSHES